MNRNYKKRYESRPQPNFEEKAKRPVRKYEPSDADLAFEGDSPRSLARLFDKTFSEDTRNGFIDPSSHLIYINLALNEKSSIQLKLNALSTLETNFSTLLTPLKQEDIYYEAKDSIEWISIFSDNEEISNKAKDILALF